MVGICGQAKCEKMLAILDQDPRPMVAAGAAEEACRSCPEPKEVIAMCNLSDRGEVCPGAICPMFLRCWYEPVAGFIQAGAVVGQE